MTRWIVVDAQHAPLPLWVNHWYATAAEAAEAFWNGACVMLDAED